MAGLIESYAVIGNCETTALVGRNGSIDWLGLPRFDAPACFAALLGDEGNGCWRIWPEDESGETKRAYHGDTLVLETQWKTKTGEARLIDFMTPYGRSRDVVRIIEGVSGEVAMRMRLIVRFDYGRTVPWVRHHAEGGVVAVA